MKTGNGQSKYCINSPNSRCQFSFASLFDKNILINICDEPLCINKYAPVPTEIIPCFFNAFNSNDNSNNRNILRGGPITSGDFHFFRPIYE